MSVTPHRKDKLTLADQTDIGSRLSPSETDQLLLLQLKNHEADAIRHVAKRIGAFLSGSSAAVVLSREDREELINDTVFITLKKIGDGQFAAEKASPVTYAIAIAKNLLGNRLQKKRVETTQVDRLAGFHSTDPDPEKYLQKKEKEELLGKLLLQLGEPCSQLILLRYYEGITDEDAIDRNLTPYANADSLKVQRSKCLKKLAESVRKHQAFFR